MIIDPPTPFASLAEWIDFRAEMARLIDQLPGNDEVRQHLEQADAEIEKREGGAGSSGG